MRKGYAIKYDGDGFRSSFVCPAGGVLARMERNRDGRYFVACEFAEVRGQTVPESKLMKVLGDIEEQHYLSTTTRKQRFHDRLNKCVDYPMVKLIGIVAAIVAATASVRGCIG